MSGSARKSVSGPDFVEAVDSWGTTYQTSRLQRLFQPLDKTLRASPGPMRAFSAGAN